ncbi:MAG: DMT family transporter [Thermodesulfovibrionales bacterium]|nr:DMT family transporter [Thermodesulfovibrionales bacterium]
MDYSWVLLSLISAFTLATSDALTKKALTSSNEYIVAWLRLIFSLPLLFVIFLFIPVPELDRAFYTAFLLALPLEILSIVLYIKALRLSPLSLTLPFLALTPVFLIFVSYAILGEKVSLWGGAGILLIAAGSYTLNISKIKEGIFEPLRAITKEKGSVLMIGVALIYSFTSSLGKMAIEHSSPLFFGVTYFTVLAFFFTPVALSKGREGIGGSWGRQSLPHALLLPGIFYSLMVVSHMIAMSLAKVAYVISVKRMSLIIGVLFGYLFFKEKNIRERLFGTMLMFIGFVMVVTA